MSKKHTKQAMFSLPDPSSVLDSWVYLAFLIVKLFDIPKIIF